MSHLSIFDLTIIGKYFNNFNDFVNLIKTNKEYSNILSNYHFNPISLTHNLFKYFSNIQTFHYYTSEDKCITHNCNNYIDWSLFDITRLNEKTFNKSFKKNTIYKNLYLKLIRENCQILNLLKNLDSINFKEINFDIRCCNELIEIDLNNLNVYKISGSIYKCNNLTYLNLKNTLNYNINVEDCKNLIDLNFMINDNNKIKYKYYYGNDSLKNIKLSTDITSIGHNMFNECYNLSNIEIYKDDEKLNDLNNIKVLGYECFKNCGFKTLEFKNIRKCEKSVFENCKKLESIILLGSYVSMISTFYKCTNLTNIVIPKHVRTLNRTFICCSNLINIDLPTALTNINEAFTNCINLKNIDLSYCTKLSEIQKHAFNNCVNLENVILPNSVTSIGTQSFYKCEKLININLDNVNKIGLHSFEKCNSLNMIMLNCNIIENHAFEDCVNLESIINSSNKIIMKNNSFKNCKKLKNIYCKGELIKYKDTFNGCDMLN